MDQIWHWAQAVGASMRMTCANPSKTFSNELILFPHIRFQLCVFFFVTSLKLDVFASALFVNAKLWFKSAGWSCLCSNDLTSPLLQNQLSGYLLRKFKNSNGWQKLWVVFTNFCLFFYKTHQVPTNTHCSILFYFCVCIKATVQISLANNPCRWPAKINMFS